MKFKIVIVFVLSVILALFIISCEREWDNLWDENSNLTGEDWAPSELIITINSISSVTLTWKDNSDGEEGFKIDRKINQNSWATEFSSTNSNTTTFNDDAVDVTANEYTYRVYAFKANNNSEKIETSIPSYCYDSRDGSFYETIKIGTQYWMKENLAYLPSVSPPSNGSQSSAYYYVYDYSGSSVAEAKATANYKTYGVLYNWTAALTACPEGWHLPTDSEWDVLVNYLGGSSVAGGKMKSTATIEAGTGLWHEPNTGATNESGFTGLPGGHRYYSGSFYDVGYYGGWWSSTEDSSTDAWRRSLYYANDGLTRDDNYKEYGFSVRCVKDE